MLRGFATMTFYADDLDAAARWYTEVLGIEPYFEKQGYREFRVGDDEDELGLIDARYVPHLAAGRPSGTVTYWHVEDLPAAFERLLSLGATEFEGPTERGEGFVTASVVDPFGNVLGIMYNPHYVEILARR